MENQTKDDQHANVEIDSKSSDDEQIPQLSPVTIVIQDSADETKTIKTEHRDSTEKTTKRGRASLTNGHPNIDEEFDYSHYSPPSTHYSPPSPGYSQPEQTTSSSKKSTTSPSPKRRQCEDSWTMRLSNLHKGGNWIDVPIQTGSRFLDVSRAQLALQCPKIISEQEYNSLYIKFTELSRISAICSIQHLSPQRIIDLDTSTVLYASDGGISESELNNLDNLDCILVPGCLSQTPNIYIIAKFRYSPTFEGQKLPKKRITAILQQTAVIVNDSVERGSLIERFS